MPSLSEEELASQYGYAMAVLNSNPELKELFRSAVAETWTADKFQAKLRATAWYKTTSEPARNAQVLKSTDPKTYRANVLQVKSRLTILAAEYGANITASALSNLAESAYTFGWDDNQIRQNMAQYVSFSKGTMKGAAGQWEVEWRGEAADQGLRFSDTLYQAWARDVAAGRATVDDVKQKMRGMAASAYPHLADRIKGGETIATISEPYRQTMAELLEMAPEAIKMSDPMIKKALAVKDAKGQVQMQTLYDFENTLRNDQRWLKTSNAQDEAMTVTRRVLSDMGVLGG